MRAPAVLAAVFLVILTAGALTLTDLPARIIGEDCKPRFVPQRHRDRRPEAAPPPEQRCAPDITALRAPVTSPFDLYEVEPVLMPAYVDSNSPAFWSDGALYLFNSAWGETYRSSADSPDNLAEPLLIEMPVLPRPGTVWLEAIWKDRLRNVLYGWYHFEPEDVACATAPIIGAAISYDEGVTWEDRGFILENAYGVDCSYNNGYFTGGNGDMSVIIGPADRHFYFLFSNYAGPLEEQGIAIARSLVSDRGLPGTVFKYYRDRWEEPGIGGKATAIFATSTGWKGPYVESFWGPSIHWNTYIGSYVALLNHTAGEEWVQEGIYISFSQDLLHWTEPEKILESPAWYPQVLGLGASGTDIVAGKEMRIFVGGFSNYVLEFRSLED